jgi:Mn-dependent DtxR family transcriptional regulator
MPTRGMTPKRGNHGSLTPRQADVIHAVRAIQERTGIPPSLDEIASELEIARPTVYVLVSRVRGKGYLTTTPGKYRSIRLTAAASTIKKLKAQTPAA